MLCHELFKLSLVIPGRSTFLELGAGAGKPSFHLSSFFRCLTVGVEVDFALYFASIGNLKKVYLKASELGFHYPPVALLHRDIYGLLSFNPFDIIYSFDKLFEPELLRHIARVFNDSTKCKVFISYQKPLTLHAVGFVGLALQSKLRMKMIGSGEMKTCYIYTRHCTGERRNESLPLPVDPIVGEILMKHSNGSLIDTNRALDLRSLGGTQITTRSSGRL